MASKYDAPPPKYEEVVEMGDIGKDAAFSPSAPLLVVDFKSANTIKIVKAATTRQWGPFNFYIRDYETETPLMEGEVGYKRCATISKNDGSSFATITDVPDSDPRYTKTEEFKKCVQYNISRRNTYDGMLALEPGFESLTFVNERGTRPYLLQATVDKNTEVLISRSNGEGVLVKITCPERKGYEPFECSIEFSGKTEEPVTEDEKELLVSVVVAIMTHRVGRVMTHGQHKFWSGLGVVIALGILAAIIYGIVALFQHLNANCNRPGYRCGGKRY